MDNSLNLHKYFGQFVEEDLENSFRSYNRKSDYFQVKLYIYFTIFLYMVYTVIDVFTIELESTIYITQIVRAALILLSIVVIFYIKKINNTKHFDFVLLIWLLSFLSSEFVMNSSNLNLLESVIVWDVIIIFTSITIIPIKSQYLITSFVYYFFIIITLWSINLDMVLENQNGVTYAIAYIFTMIFAYLIRWQLNRTRRQQYWAYLVETEAKEKLELALKDVRELQGLIPICSNCKQIRDDKGYWGSVETYLSQHSRAKLSHSICPDCASKLYPDIDFTKTKP
ncbi:MAG: hypothetical protein KAI81_02520 [Candidatus Marinimicrobia bacterium]|nr:hypothetical protein [Candidatus Neomarinimicrobiota bacterium]